VYAIPGALRVTQRAVLWPVAIAIAVLGLLVPAGAIAAARNGAAPGQTSLFGSVTPPAQAAAKCRGAQAVVGGVVKCVRVGDKCQKRYARQYLVADLVCARVGKRGHKQLRLRKANYAEARQGRIIDIGSNGRLTLQQAKWYFDQTVAHLPGVKVPRGAVGRDSLGTDAIKSLDLYRNRLTAAQLKVLDAVIVPAGKPVAVVNPDGSIASTHGPAVRARRAIALSALSGTLSEAVMRLRQHGVFFKHPIAVSELTKKADPDDDGETVALWLFKKKNGQPRGSECSVELDPALLSRSIAEIRETLVHELMHCAAGEQVSSEQGWDAQPKFLDEGLPEWASYRVSLEWSGTVVQDGWWEDYLTNPEVGLFKRSYDAAGWWSLVEHEGTDPFKIFPQLVHAGATGSAGAVYNVVLNAGAGDQIKDDWGPTLAQIAAYGPRWDMNGPGEIMRPEPDRGAITESSSPAVGAAETNGADEFKADLQADIIVVTGPKHGNGFLRDSAGTDWVLTSDEQRFCTDPNGCFCPDGTQLDYPSMKDGEAHVGFSTQSGSDTVTVDGQSTDDDPACKGKTSSGIMVLDSQSAALLTTFTTGTCSVKGGHFKAHASAGGYTLDVTINAFSGYNHEYNLDYGSSDPRFVVTGGAGPYSNSYPIPNGVAVGGILFNAKGTRMSLGFQPAANSSLSAGIDLAGAIQCKRPKKGQ
jgi:hypothetical protein